MNENNQPQSQQTENEGLKNILKDVIADFRRIYNNLQRNPCFAGHHDDFSNKLEMWNSVINEAKKNRSHSPTEQPGDAKPLIERLNDYARDYTNTTYHEALILEAVRQLERLKLKYAQDSEQLTAQAAELDKLRTLNQSLTDERNGLGYDLLHVTAERDELNTAIAHVWKALGVTDYTGKHISEHVSDLRAQIEAADKLIDWHEGNHKASKP